MNITPHINFRRWRSPWDNSPEFDNHTESIIGEGQFRSIVWACPSEKYVPGRGECGLAIGHHDGSFNNPGVFQGFQLALPAGDYPDRTWDGIRMRGSGTIRDVLIRGVRGFNSKKQEAFGILVQNRDPATGIYHGGVTIEDVTVICHPSTDPYETGVSVGTQNHEPKTPLMWSHVRRTRCVQPSGGSQAGFTGGNRVVFEDCEASGFANFFNNDTGSMDHIELINPRGTVSNAVVRLAASPESPKSNLLVRGGHITFTGPGPFRILEAFNLKGASIANIIFDGLTVSAPLGTKVIAVSTDAAHIENVQFNGCALPQTLYCYTPHMGTAARSALRINNQPLTAHAVEYK